jgi:zinc and cadmium transporter
MEITMSAEIYAILSVILVSSVSLTGIFFLKSASAAKGPIRHLFNRDMFSKLLPFLVSFSVGGLFGDAFIHLLPEAFEHLENDLVTSLHICLGLIFFFSLEKFIRWKHCHDLDLDHQECKVHSASTMILIGDSIHNFIDGMLIGASYSVSIPIGISTTLAVFFHEIPQETGDFGILIHSGYSVKKALVVNFLTGITAVIGVLIALFIGPRVEWFAFSLLPFTAGGFIYIAGSDLIPELHTETKVKESMFQLTAIIMGISVMAALTLLE